MKYIAIIGVLLMFFTGCSGPSPLRYGTGLRQESHQQNKRNKQHRIKQKHQTQPKTVPSSFFGSLFSDWNAPDWLSRSDNHNPSPKKYQSNNSDNLFGWDMDLDWLNPLNWFDFDTPSYELNQRQQNSSLFDKIKTLPDKGWSLSDCKHLFFSLDDAFEIDRLMRLLSVETDISPALQAEVDQVLQDAKVTTQLVEEGDYATAIANAKDQDSVEKRMHLRSILEEQRTLNKNQGFSEVP